jgi:hypothetical protein
MPPLKKKRKTKGPSFKSREKLVYQFQIPVPKHSPSKNRENLVYQFEVPIPQKKKKRKERPLFDVPHNPKNNKRK